LLSSTTVSGLVPRDEIPRPLDQHSEHVERARADCQRSKNAAFILPEQAAAAPVEAKAVEQENVARGEQRPHAVSRGRERDPQRGKAWRAA